MRMWMVNPEVMCRKHLLGEHVEHHMFVGSIKKGINLDGYVANNLMEPAQLQARHEALVAEMKARGYNHKSPLEDVSAQVSAYPQYIQLAEVDPVDSLRDLLDRCPDCRARYEGVE